MLTWYIYLTLAHTAAPCLVNPCFNTGICNTVNATAYTCSCQAPFSGGTCQTYLYTWSAVNISLIDFIFSLHLHPHSASNQFESTPATLTSARTCISISTCTNSQYQLTPPTATTNRNCSPISTCTSTQYQLALPTATADRSCGNLTACTSLQYQLIAPSPSTDRTCMSLTTCSNLQYQSTPVSYTHLTLPTIYSV